MLRLAVLALCLSSPMAFHVPSSLHTLRIGRNLAISKKMRPYETCSRSRPISPRMVATHPLDGHIPIDDSFPGDEKPGRGEPLGLLWLCNMFSGRNQENS
jgi:hypothetical protein